MRAAIKIVWQRHIYRVSEDQQDKEICDLNSKWYTCYFWRVYLKIMTRLSFMHLY